MPNIIPQSSVNKERDLSPVNAAKRRTSIYGNYKRPKGTELDATLELGYMLPVNLQTQPEYMKIKKDPIKKQQINTKQQLY